MSINQPDDNTIEFVRNMQFFDQFENDFFIEYDDIDFE